VNDYYRVAKPFLGEFNSYSKRRELVKRFSWAIPNDEAIAAIAALPRIVEIGAGTGYWASLIQAAGGDIIAYDLAHQRENPWGHNVEHFPIQWGGVSKLRTPECRDRQTLFLCWPPYGEPMAFQSLRSFKGQWVAYVGEGGWGCTGDEKFHLLLAKKWELTQEVRIPQWYGIHDSLMIYKRRVGINKEV